MAFEHPNNNESDPGELSLSTSEQILEMAKKGLVEPLSNFFRIEAAAVQDRENN